jgi:AraC-like DNA-binding protein
MEQKGTKVLDIKTKRQINGKRVYRPRDPMVGLVAQDCGCSERQVRNIINGEITGNRRMTALQEKVAVAYALRMDAAEQLTKEIRARIKGK